jgi:hypothetical protein
MYREHGEKRDVSSLHHVIREQIRAAGNAKATQHRETKGVEPPIGT